MVISEDLRRAIEACVSSLGASVIDLRSRGRVGNRVYEVFIDNEEGVTLQFCSEVSKQLKPLIDRMTVDSEYRLVVSSPGFERSLKLPWQFGKHVGKLMRVTHSLAEGFEETTGRLVSVDRESIVLRDDTTKVERRFPFSEILDAHLKAPW